MDGYAAEGGATVISADFDYDDDGEADASGTGGDCDDSNPDVRPGGEDFRADGVMETATAAFASSMVTATASPCGC